MPVQPGNDVVIGDIVGGGTLRLTAKQRSRHVWAVGGTGVGKSKLFESMIRQDIDNWPRSRCGLMLLDPHGAVYDGIMEWLAENKTTKLPIIPIDLRRDDWVPAYNLLRARSDAKPSVVVQNFVDAIAHVWGQQGTDQTPAFARWSSAILTTLYEKHQTLIEALHLIDPHANHIRRVLTDGLADPAARRHWREAAALPVKDFLEQVSSTVNRFERFWKNEHLRAILGQTEVSLDLGKAIEEGAIILVSLATAGGNVHDEDADTFGSLLLTDLWTAAKARGKRDGVKPFYLYCDEFQSFISPTISRTLDQARGFGLHMNLANQYPNQLLNEGKCGKALYDSAIANASTKIVFRTEHPENLKTLAQSLFMGVFDPNLIKHKLYSTKVMEYREEIQEDESRGTTSLKGGARGTTVGETSTTGSSIGQSIAPGEEALAAWNEFTSEMSSDGQSQSESESEHWASGESRTVTRRKVLRPMLGQELSSIQFLPVDEQLFMAMQSLFVQEDRHCAVRVVGTRAPVFLRTPYVQRGQAMPRRINRFLEGIYQKWPFFLPMQEATNRLIVREQKLLDSIHQSHDEPQTAMRRIKKPLK